MQRTYEKKYWDKNVKFVCNRDNISYEVKEENEKSVTVEINARIDELEILEEDALCEKQRNDIGSKIPVYSYRTLINPEKKERLMKFYRHKGFIVYKPDLEKCKRNCL